MTKKGFIKLITRPHIFIRDYIEKKQRKLSYIFPVKKVEGSKQYSVVSAIYNVEKYLDDYFKSLVNQSLDFEKHIFLILVDDGSPDNSADIIKKWQKKYPNNIRYIKKENGGQASARNLGLKYVQNEWVTFIDPDDFVDIHYFENIDNFLTKNSEEYFSLISCNIKFYYEKNGTYKNRHPLKFKFTKTENIVSSDNLGDNIQFSVSSSFMRTKLLKEQQIEFKDIKPNFEDGHFINIFLLNLENYNHKTKVAFLKKSIYYYRKREDESSTLDTSWDKKERYLNVTQDGFLDLLENAVSIKGSVPRYIQRTVLYDIVWYFKYLINNENRVSFFSDKEKNRFKNTLRDIFSYIDSETIESSNLAGAWFYHKVGLLGVMKNYALNYQIVYVEDYDLIKNEVLLRYFSYFDSVAICLGNNQEILPTCIKIRRHEFLGEKFVDEYNLWIPLEEIKRLNIFVDNCNTRISFGGKHYFNGVDVSSVQKFFQTKKVNIDNLPLQVKIKRRVYQSSFYANKFRDVWLFIDRDTQADDNAEHLYRYIKNNYPQINAYFILRKNSHDWDRLKSDNFNLIKFGSIEYEASLIHAKHIISSHADTYVMNYLPHKYYKDILNFKYTFLQHGVIKDDLSSWLNSKNINCFITTALNEYNSIIENYTKYKFSKKEIVLTGLPRHDRLIENNSLDKKVILIIPTWRQSLVGKTLGKSSSREKNENFMDTLYAKSWKSLLDSKKLKELVNRYQYRVVFFPHANIQPYIELFSVPSYIDVISHHSGSIQSLFLKASLMITDYSSVAFEMGILGKETIYYQFDYNNVFNGEHTYQKGYFDYIRDGFGPVCYREEEVLKALSDFFEQSIKTSEKYIKRMQKFFAYHDTNNCKRVYNAILELYNPNRKVISNDELLKFAKDALRHKAWKGVEYRYELLQARGVDIKDIDLILSNSKLHLGKVDEAIYLIDKYIVEHGKSIDTNKIYQNIIKVKKLLNSLIKEDKELLVNESEDLFITLSYRNITQWFKERRWELLSVAIKLIDKRLIQKKDLTYFYYIALITANELNNEEDRLLYSLLVKIY